MIKAFTSERPKKNFYVIGLILEKESTEQQKMSHIAFFRDFQAREFKFKSLTSFKFKDFQ